MSTLKGWLQCFVHASIQILGLYGVQEATISCSMAHKSFITEAAEGYRLHRTLQKPVAFNAILEPVSSENSAVEDGSVCRLSSYCFVRCLRIKAFKMSPSPCMTEKEYSHSFFIKTPHNSLCKSTLTPFPFCAFFTPSSHELINSTLQGFFKQFTPSIKPWRMHLFTVVSL
ncbi:Uncharacterised protein [Klebsiella variicola]|nr:Uncharacterised protein [Klebsiella variicola]